LLFVVDTELTLAKAGLVTAGAAMFGIGSTLHNTGIPPVEVNRRAEVFSISKPAMRSSNLQLCCT